MGGAEKSCGYDANLATPADSKIVLDYNRSNKGSEKFQGCKFQITSIGIS
jgi:hypothetical protein